MHMPVSAERFVTVFLCGDVMTGRGIDQILPHPREGRRPGRLVVTYPPIMAALRAYEP